MAWSRDPNRRRGAPPAQRHRIMTAHHGICHLCRHAGAEQIDHVINVRTWLRQSLPGSPHRDSNLAPAHQAPCPTCGVRCHQVKTTAEAKAGSAQRTARRRPVEQHPGRITTP